MSVNRDAGTGRVKAVKRNLFGTVDHEQIRDDLDREMKRITEEKKRKWNFDFENCQPLRGRFRWERVGKRLQTRKSTESIPPCAAESSENVCRQITVDPSHSSTRYNLRTRDKELENINVNDFQPIGTARKRSRKFGERPVENPNTGHYEKQRNAKEGKTKTAIVHAGARSKSRR